VEKHDVYLEMWLKIQDVFEHSAVQSEYYKQANTTIETEERQKAGLAAHSYQVSRDA